MKRFMFIFALLIVATVGLVAQVEPPTDIGDVVVNINTWMGSLAGLAALSVFATGFINGLFQNVKGWVRQIISWVVPILLAVLLGTLLNIGFLGDEPVAIAILYGLGAGLVSNGLFDIPVVKAIIVFLEQHLGNKEITT